MNLETAIKSRRSIRKYKNSDLDISVIHSILNISIYSPYPKAYPNWNAIIFHGDTKIQLNKMLLSLMHLKNETGSSTHNSLKTCIKAPVLLFIMSKYIADEKTKTDSLLNHSYTEATGAFIQNILLCAASYGLGSLWVNDILYYRDEIEKYLKTSDKLMSAVLIGYMDDQSLPPKNVKYEDLVHVFD